MPVSRRRKSGKDKVTADRLQKQKERSAKEKEFHQKKLQGPFFSNRMIKSRTHGATKHLGTIDEVEGFEQK
jgi:hypothetical protein